MYSIYLYYMYNTPLDAYIEFKHFRRSKTTGSRAHEVVASVREPRTPRRAESPRTYYDLVRACGTVNGIGRREMGKEKKKKTRNS